jgi:hypothetical protein
MTHLTKQAGVIKQALENPSSLQWVETLAGEVRPLLRAVDFSQITTALDPFSGAGIVASELRSVGVTVTTNDLNRHWSANLRVDALQPSLYQSHRVQCIVSSPWFAVLDIAIPLAVLHCPFAAFHCPGHYLTNAPIPRQHYFSKLQSEGRLHVIMGLPRGATGYRCIWVCIFSDSSLRAKLVRSTHLSSSLSISWAEHAPELGEPGFALGDA